MTDKKKMRDKRIWVRMGWELAALYQLLCETLCDTDFNEVMDKKTWCKLKKAIEAVDDVRACADYRSSIQGVLFGPCPFYGGHLNPARDMADEYREKLGAEAVASAVQLYGKSGRGLP